MKYLNIIICFTLIQTQLAFAVNYPSPLDYVKTPSYPAQTILLVNQDRHSEPKPVDPKDAAGLYRLYKETLVANQHANGAYQEMGSALSILIDVFDPGMVVGGAIGGVPGAIAGKMVNDKIKGYIDGSVKELSDEADRKAKQILISSVKNLYAKDPLFFTYPEADQYKRIMEFRATEDMMMGDVVKNHQDNAIMQTYMMRAMRDTTIKAHMANIEHHAVTQSMIDDLKVQGIEYKNLSGKQSREIMDKIESLGMGIIKIEQQRQKDNLELVKAQNKMITSLGNLTKVTLEQGVEISQTNGNVLTIKEFMYSKMTVEEKLANLDKMKDVYKDENQRKEIKTQLEALDSRIKFDQKMNDIFKGGQLAVGIAGNLLGVPPKFLGDVSKGLAVAEAGKNLVMALTASSISPLGVMGAVGALSGLFMKQTDPAAERHKEVMESFKQISEQIRKGNEIILTEIGKVEEGIQAISQQVSDLDKKMVIVGKELFEINAKLTSIQISIAGVSEQIRKGFYRDYEFCRDNFIKNLKGKKYSEIESYLTYSKIKTQSDLLDCIKGFRYVLEEDKSSDYLKTFVDVPDDFSKYNFHTAYKKTIELLNSINADVSISKLISPNNAHWALQAKHEGSDTKKVNFDWSALGDPLDHTVVTEIVQNYLLFYPVTYLFAQNCHHLYCDYLRPGCKLPEGCEYPGTPLIYLKNALSLVQMAIAQYTIVGGDEALFFIVEKLKNNPDQDFVSKLNELMALNPVFAHNVLVAYVRDFLMINGSHEKFYAMALGVPNGVGGRKIIDELGLPFKFSHETKNGVMSAYFMAKRPKFGEVKIYMPTIEDVNEGTLQVMPELLGYQAGGRFQTGLLAVRNRLIEAIADIRTMEKVKASTNEVLKKTYVDLLN